MPPNRFSPLYRWLTETLRDEFQNAVYKPGDLIPTERELVKRYAVSSITVTRALNELVREGWIYRQAGKGTFLKRDKLEERLARLTSFAEEMHSRSIVPQYRLVRAKSVTPSPEIAHALQLSSHDHVYLIERLHLAEGEPLALAKGYWISEIGERLAQLDLNNIPLYETVERQFHIPLLEADESISATAADADIARKLGVPRRAPLLLQERLTFSTAMRPIHLTMTFFRADRYKYKIRLSRQ
ncbi:MAG: GntR family transcriptional regulator [Chloroflexi bacterium]|nr:GntR family transcriptional regulator [Chloroflexota bacterium]